jgi:hypothetical protein
MVVAHWQRLGPAPVAEQPQSPYQDFADPAQVYAAFAPRDQAYGAFSPPRR